MERLKVFIDRLTHEDIFNYSVPSFLKNEKNLKFDKEILIKGKAYLVNDYLIINLFLKTSCYIPCIICNDFTKYLIEEKLYLNILLKDIKGAIYDFSKKKKKFILKKITKIKKF